MSHLLLDFFGCNSTALSSTTSAVLVLVVLLVVLVVFRGSVTVASITELSARARLRVARVVLAG